MHPEQERMYRKKDGTYQTNHHEHCQHDYKEIDFTIKTKICRDCGKLSLECKHSWGYHDGMWGCNLCGVFSYTAMPEKY
jgi:hypothetical protein